MPFTIIKFSSEDCGTCHRMSHYDSKVCAELGIDFIGVMMQDAKIYRQYRNILISKYPKYITNATRINTPSIYKLFIICFICIYCCFCRV